MISTILLAIGGVLVVLALAFNFHWFSDQAPWAGWASTGCAAGAVFCLTIAGRAGGA